MRRAYTGIVSIDQERQQAHEYLDRLPAAQLSAVRNLLESLLDPLEDEDISEAEEAAAAEARGWLLHNAPIPHEEVLAELGLTLADFERMGQTPLPYPPNASTEKPR